MNDIHLTSFSMVLWAAAYLAIMVVVTRRRGVQETVIRYLILYTLAGFLIDLSLASFYLGWPLSIEKIAWLPVYGATLLLWLFLALSDEFLNRQLNIWWLGIGGIWVGFLLMLWIATGISDTLLHTTSVNTALLVLSIITCLALILRVAFLILIAFYQSRQSLYRNRIIYWVLALILITIGDGLILAKSVAPGAGLRMLGILVATYAIWSYRQANLAQVSLRLFAYIILGLFSAIVYSVGFFSIQSIFNLENISFGSGLTLAVGLALISSTMLGFIITRLQQRAFGEGYDTSQVVRDYSLGITNIVDVNRLSRTSLELIAKSFDVQSGFFFLIDQEHIDKALYYWLRPLANLGEREYGSGRILATNPLILHFLRERQPVIQYDIEVLPDFKEMDEAELLWLSDLNMDVFIPICTSERWLGLLVLGQKPGNSQYSAQDLLLLATLAEQTVVALENARLVADLEDANANLHTAFLQLERANSDLREIDELKSSFIGVVSHEMRTPLANVGFSLQIFERHGLDNLKPGQVEEFQELKNSFQLATLMIENLVLLASFLNRQVAAQVEQLDIRQTLQNVLPPFIAKARKKEVLMKLDIIGELPLLTADRKLIANAIYQLVHNALKFTDSGGNIWITCWATSNAICVDVKDTGRGIPADRLQEMWREFTQMADPLKRGLEGLGLGLSLVRHIIALHGGEVWAESTVGQGSAFGFQLPIAGPKQANSPKEIFRRRMVVDHS